MEKTHDLQRLCDALAAKDAEEAAALQDAADELSEAYTEDRYPGFDFDDEQDWPGLERLMAEIQAYALRLDRAEIGADAKGAISAAPREKHLTQRRPPSRIALRRAGRGR